MPRKRSGRPRGAPSGNRNALKNGAHTGDLRALRRHVRLQIAQANALIAQALLVSHPPLEGGSNSQREFGVGSTTAVSSHPENLRSAPIFDPPSRGG
jgi:hypothetical protein